MPPATGGAPAHPVVRHRQPAKFGSTISRPAADEPPYPRGWPRLPRAGQRSSGGSDECGDYVADLRNTTVLMVRCAREDQVPGEYGRCGARKAPGTPIGGQMLIVGVMAGIVLPIVVWVVRRRTGGRFRYRPMFEAACEVTVGGRRLVAYSGHRKEIRLGDPAAREDVAVLVNSRTWVRALCEVRVDGTPLLASGGRDGVVRLWNLEDRGELVASFTGHRGWVFALCTVRVSGRELLASAGRDHTVRLWDPSDGRLVRAIDTGRGRGWIFALCQVRTGGRTLIAAGHGNGTVLVWNPESTQADLELTAHKGVVWTLCEVSDSDHTLLATAGRDGVVRLWDLEAPQEARALTAGAGPVYALCQADAGDRTVLVAGGDGPGTAVWDPFTGERVGDLGMDLAGLISGHGWVRAVCQVRPPEGPPLLVTVGYDDGARVWDVAKETGT
ncbi:hypothetical protein DDW44_06320 [Streptomyces tirandamycinicus]|uniref:Uncharacterized protein n=2 Tax=Streptomyces tirandamycinicus TaxID=2174846 RepID=A0A2S1SQ31_9ACTN|nr:hypothetical protein DDW44_06320 [Streptomyces tirandamycinicus]